MKLKEGLNEVSNTGYHADRTWLSSSSLKKLLKNPAQFHHEDILGNRPPEGDNPAFQEGSLVHSLILEPDLIAKEYAFFEGLRKAGPEWEAFKEANKGRTVMSKPQRERCNYYIKGYRSHPTALGLISGGQPEFTICQYIEGVPLKVRPDYINLDKGYIVDVKTSSFPVDLESFKITVTQYQYELSAALYTAVATQYFGKPFDFYWLCVSKKDAVCEVFRMSQATARAGILQVAKSLALYKQCMATGIWTATEVVEPDDYEIQEL